MSSLQSTKEANLNHQIKLVDLVSAVLPEAKDFCPEVPPVPAKLLDRKDLSRLFDRHADTPHRWEQDGWLTAIRKPSGRIAGYPAEQVAAVATRLFARYPGFKINQFEAERLGYLPLLTWVEAAVRNTVANTASTKEPLLELLDFAALANAPELVDGLRVTATDLDDHRAGAISRLRMRLSEPYARHLLFNAWRQSGIAARVRTISQTTK